MDHPGIRLAPADVQPWVDSVRAQGSRVFALIDGCEEASHAWRRSSAMVAASINLFAERTADPAALRIAPWLWPLATPTDGVGISLTRYTEQSAELPFASLIATPLDLAELAARLRRRIEVDADGLPMMLRLWDPRVLRVLPQALQPATASALLAFGLQALMPDRAGAHQVIELVCPHEDPLTAAKVALSRGELDALLDSSYPDALLGSLRQHGEKLLTRVEDAKRYTLALTQWRACKAHGITSSQDQVLALSLAIEHGEDWWTQPRWQVVVERAGAGSLTQVHLAMSTESEQAECNSNGQAEGPSPSNQ